MEFVFVRKIDELGRVVLPRDIRNNLKLKMGDEIDVSVVDGAVILKKTKKEETKECLV